MNGKVIIKNHKITAWLLHWVFNWVYLSHLRIRKHLRRSGLSLSSSLPVNSKWCNIIGCEQCSLRHPWNLWGWQCEKGLVYNPRILCWFLIGHRERSQVANPNWAQCPSIYWALAHEEWLQRLAMSHTIKSPSSIRFSRVAGEAAHLLNEPLCSGCWPGRDGVW